MTDYVTLMGAEEVARAGRSMQAAATEMTRAASQMDETSRFFLSRFEELVMRLEAALIQTGKQE